MSFSSVKKMIQRLIRRRKVMKDPRAAGKLSIKQMKHTGNGHFHLKKKKERKKSTLYQLIMV